MQDLLKKYESEIKEITKDNEISLTGFSYGCTLYENVYQLTAYCDGGRQFGQILTKDGTVLGQWKELKKGALA